MLCHAYTHDESLLSLSGDCDMTLPLCLWLFVAWLALSVAIGLFIHAGNP